LHLCNDSKDTCKVDSIFSNDSFAGAFWLAGFIGNFPTIVNGIKHSGTLDSGICDSKGSDSESNPMAYSFEVGF
jgi:hypothetical protein